MDIPILSDIANAVGTFVGKGLKPILDKIAGDKMSESDKALIALEAGRLANDAVQKEKDSFHQFVIEHTGAAKDMPRLIQVLRGSVRPMLTYATFGFVVWGAWYLLTHAIPVAKAELVLQLVALMKAMILIVLGFWFGERLLTRSGIVQTLLARKNNSDKA